MLKCEFYCTSESRISLNDANNYVGLRVPFVGISNTEFDDAISTMQDSLDTCETSPSVRESIVCKYDLDKCYSDYSKYFMEKVFDCNVEDLLSEKIIFFGVTHHPNRIHEDKLYVYILKEALNEFFRKNTLDYQKALYRKFGRYSGHRLVDKNLLIELTQDFFIQWYEQGGCYKLEPDWYNVPDDVQELYDYDGVEYNEEDEELNIKNKLKCH